MGALPHIPFPQLTFDDYCRKEAGNSEKSEFFAGYIYAMAGASPVHNRISANVNSALTSLFDPRRCDTFGPEQAIVTPGQQGCFYPDGSVVCGESVPDLPLRISNPVLVVEILSPGNRETDWTIKLPEYKRIPSLLHILFIDSERVEVSHFSRSPENTWLADPVVYRSLPDQLRLEPWQIIISLEKIYFRTGLAPTA